jgi:hypothetical protein
MKLIHQINDNHDVTNMITSSYWHIACHVIIMRDWLIINHKGGWFLQLTNEQILKKKKDNLPKNQQVVILTIVAKPWCHGLLMSFAITQWLLWLSSNKSSWKKQYSFLCLVQRTRFVVVRVKFLDLHFDVKSYIEGLNISNVVTDQ